MRKQSKLLKGAVGSLLLSVFVLMTGLVAEASSIDQSLPQTGEEIAKTGLVVGGIIIVIVIIIILIRRKKK